MLHACCGPCLLEPLDDLASKHEVRVVYANPNIHPREEYEHRRDTLIEWAVGNDVRVDELPYEPEEWDAAVTGLEDDPDRRCRACYRLRVSLAARHAVAVGYDAVATTLTVSPYQDHDALVEAARAACEEAGVAYLDTDYRDRYPQATSRSRELGMYRQNYCGCRYSDAEAERERTQRREARRVARQRPDRV